MRAMRATLVGIILSITAAGCVTPNLGPMEPPGVSNEVRKAVHRLAVRGPSPPTVSLTSDLDGKGAATGKTAAAAGLGWLGGTMQAAGEAGDGGALVLAFGLVTTPFAVAGGALYGAAASDTREAITEGNKTLISVLDFAPERFRRVLERTFADSVPVAYEFTDDLSDGELAARGFDAVLDIRMDALTSSPSENRLHAYFYTASSAELRVFDHADLTRVRTYDARLPDRAVSSWAKDGGRQALGDLDASYEDMAGRMVDDFFLRKSIQVQGIEPVSRGWSVGTISGTVPMFVWSAHDGAKDVPAPDVVYEVLVYTGSQAPDEGIRTETTRYVPAEPLKKCKRYRWRVRAHYETFGQPTQSNWSPVYQFKTPCRGS